MKTKQAVWKPWYQANNKGSQRLQNLNPAL